VCVEGVDHLDGCHLGMCQRLTRTAQSGAMRSAVWLSLSRNAAAITDTPGELACTALTDLGYHVVKSIRDNAVSAVHSAPVVRPYPLRA
jgi:hypothetical protein